MMMTQPVYRIEIQYEGHTHVLHLEAPDEQEARTKAPHIWAVMYKQSPLANIHISDIYKL